MARPRQCLRIWMPGGRSRLSPTWALAILRPSSALNRAARPYRVRRESAPRSRRHAESGHAERVGRRRCQDFSGWQATRNPSRTLTWSKFRGPGAVKFANSKPPVEKADGKWKTTPAFSGKATTTATFSEPGEYVLHVVANDWSGDGGGGFQCCWTNGQVKVSVKPEKTRGR